VKNVTGVSDGGCAACSLVIHAGELPVVDSQLFEPAATSGGFTAKEQRRVFAASAHCAVTADASTALIRYGDSVRSRDLSTTSSVARSLPVAAADNMATADGEGSLLLFGLSPKDPLMGLVFCQSADVIELWDTRNSAVVGAVTVLKHDDGLQSGVADVTDFSFLPSSGQVSVASLWSLLMR